MNAATLELSQTSAVDPSHPMWIANDWLEQHLAQRPSLGPAARQVLHQLCSSAALHCFQRRSGRSGLEPLLRRAADVADAVDRAFPDWSAGAAWLRGPRDRALLQEIWMHYRDLRQVRSASLDRLLLEAMVCADLRRSGWSAFAPPAAAARADSPDAPTVALIVAALLVGWLSLQWPEALSLQSLELPVIVACAGAAALRFWTSAAPTSLPPAQYLPFIPALRKAMTRECVDLRAIATSMAAAVRGGFAWSPETLQVLVRMRMNALPRPGTDPTMADERYSEADKR